MTTDDSATLRLMHDTVNDVSTILSIAQNSLLSREMPDEVQADLKRIIQTARQVAANLRQIAEILEEEED
jgi:signal transduction histidine kinase